LTWLLKLRPVSGGVVFEDDCCVLVIDVVNLKKLAKLGWFMLGLGVVSLVLSASGCVCAPVLVGVVAFQLTGLALDLTHPMIGSTDSNLVQERQKQTEATLICDANGAPPGSDCLSYEMQAAP
jgi:hypothetical protein